MRRLSPSSIYPILDWFTPPAIKLDREADQRTRMFLISHLLGPFLGHTITVYLWFLDPAPGLAYWTLVASITAFWAFPFFVRFTGQITLPALVSIQNLIFAILWGSYHYGGVSSPFLSWLLVVPLLAFFYLGSAPRLRMLVMVAIGINLAVFYGAYLVAGAFPERVPVASMQGIGVVSILCAAIYVSMMALYYANIVASESELQREVRRHRATTVQLRAAMEEAEGANRAKSEFLARMSHELRTPLNAVIGYSEMLLEDAELEGRGEEIADLQRINGAGKHLLSLVTEVLDITKIEAGKMELYIERFDLSSFIDEVAATCRQLVANNSNELIVERGGNLGMVECDATKLRQAVLNLLSNAAKFTKNGRVTISASLEKTNSGDWINIAVRDTGIGISQLNLQKLFENFSQVGPSMSGKYGGTGLGLSLSQKLCRLMGGVITVESEIGRGSCFTIRVPPLPSAAGVERPAWIDKVELPRRDEAGGDNTVLVIDDDPAALDLLQRILAKEGYRPVLADNAQAGLQIARTIHPSIILLDILMPTMDGWEVLRALKADAALETCPVVMLSMLDQRQKGLELGAADYLTKPVDREALARVLERVRPKDSGYVLVVEGADETTAEVVQGLGKDHVKFVIARDCVAALDQAKKAQPALVLLGADLPTETSFVFLAAFSRLHQPQRIPTLALVGVERDAEERKRLASMTTVLNTAEWKPAEVVRLANHLAEGRPAAKERSAEKING